MNISPVRKTYDQVTVLDFPAFHLEPGTICALIGANGSGKSTLARILAGILPADGKNARFDAPEKVGYMPQKSYAYRMSVRSNIALGGRDGEKARRLMESLQLTHLADKRADKLSGGETARMALARLLMKPFDLLILDEPTAAMDMETTALAEEQIRLYRQETGASILLVTHSLRQARRLADQVIFLQKGCLIESGSACQVLDNPKKAETAAFLEFYGK